jgi:hypothetical protein
MVISEQRQQPQPGKDRLRPGIDHGLHSRVRGGRDVDRAVVDEQRRRGVETEPAQQQFVNFAVGLGDPFDPGHDGAGEAAQEVIASQALGVGLCLHVRQGIAGQAAPDHLAQQLHPVWERPGDHLFAALGPRQDQPGVLRPLIRQGRAGFRRAQSAVVLLVPLRGAHVRQEPFHLRRIGDELPVQVTRVPVEQYPANVEHHRAQRSLIKTVRSHIENVTTHDLGRSSRESQDGGAGARREAGRRHPSHQAGDAPARPRCRTRNESSTPNQRTSR